MNNKLNNYDFYMTKALSLAQKGEFHVKANPMVGCVIVKKNQIIAQGYHKKFGDNHAEINALEQLDFNAKECDIFITLEPCSHQGKTPPCVDSIIKSNPKKVIIASLDNNPKVNSIKKMQGAGIEVVTGVLKTKADKLNRGFFKRMQTNMPFVTCKIACSLDGKNALNNGQSKWITSSASRKDVQKIRAKNQAIITGSGTILNDNPNMDVRIDKLPSPIKIVMDRSGKINDKKLNIFNGKRVIITDKTPKEVLIMLGNMGINNAIIEAGSKLNTAFLIDNLIDEIIIYQAPILMGNKAFSIFNMDIKDMQEKIKLNIKNIEMIQKDIKITASLQ